MYELAIEQTRTNEQSMYPEPHFKAHAQAPGPGFFWICISNMFLNLIWFWLAGCTNDAAYAYIRPNL